jgi:hypothetical protein
MILSAIFAVVGAILIWVRARVHYGIDLVYVACDMCQYHAVPYVSCFSFREYACHVCLGSPKQVGGISVFRVSYWDAVNDGTAGVLADHRFLSCQGQYESIWYGDLRTYF